MDFQAEVVKRLQGIKDARGPVGVMARGNTIYNGTSNAAQSGPGGADMGRPPENVQQGMPQQAQVPAAAQQAVMAQVNQTPTPQTPTTMTPQSRPVMGGSVNVSPGSVMAANPQAEKAAAQSNRKVGMLARSAMQAAAKRKISRGV